MGGGLDYILYSDFSTNGIVYAMPKISNAQPKSDTLLKPIGKLANFLGEEGTSCPFNFDYERLPVELKDSSKEIVERIISDFKNFFDCDLRNIRIMRDSIIQNMEVSGIINNICLGDYAINGDDLANYPHSYFWKRNYPNLDYRNQFFAFLGGESFESLKESYNQTGWSAVIGGNNGLAHEVGFHKPKRMSLEGVTINNGIGEFRCPLRILMSSKVIKFCSKKDDLGTHSLEDTKVTDL